MITSVQNPKVKWVRALQGESNARKEAGAFAIEGVRLVEEALAAGWEAQWVMYAEGLGERGILLLEAFRAGGVAVDQVAPHVLRAISDTLTPQGILAVLSLSPLRLPNHLDFLFVPDQMRDPGNLGSMLRTAAAASVQAAILPPGTVDAFAPKVVRAGMGAHFRLPILNMDWDEISQLSTSAGLLCYLAEAADGLPYNQADFRHPLVLVVGGEAEGAGEEVQSLAPIRVQIPMPGGGDSLNAAVAAGVLLFEVVRQRSEASEKPQIPARF